MQITDDSKNLTAAQKQWLVANEVGRPLGLSQSAAQRRAQACVRACVQGQAGAPTHSCMSDIAALRAVMPACSAAERRRPNSAAIVALGQTVEKELGNVVPPSKNTTAAGLVRRFLASKVRR